MGWFKQHIVGVFIHYVNILFMFVLMDKCYQIDDFNYLYITFLYLAFIMIYIFFTGVLNTGFKKFAFLMIALTSLVILGFAFKDNIIDFFYKEIVDNIIVINDKLYNNEITFFYLFKPTITVVFPIILIILFLLYDHRVTEGVLLLSLLEMIFFWQMEYSNEVLSMLLPFAIISIMTYMLNNYKKTQIHFQKKGIYSSISGNRLFADIVIFSVIASIIVLPLPQDIEGKDRMTLLNTLEGKNKKGTDGINIDIALSGAFNISKTGFSNTEKRLGGPIQLNKSLAFKVKSDKSYYLKGDVKDEYTGYSWKNTVDDLKVMDSTVRLEVDRAWQSNPELNLFPSSKQKEMKIYPEGLKTTSFMVPMYTTNIRYDKDGLIVGENRSIFMWKSTIDKEYTIEFYDVDYTNETQDYYGKYYIQNKDYVKYLQLPEGITERTVDLVYELVKDCSNNAEKAKKIRDYLSKNYTYTLDASVLPEGKDFVDYFLFEDPKGYCVHFATSLAIMYRIAGIPARFVEGYKMNDALLKNGLYHVTNDTAHAWVEYLVMDDVWAISDCAPTAFEESLKPEDKEKPDDKKPSPAPETDPEKKESNNTPNTKNKDNKKEEKNITSNFKINSKIIVYIVITIVVVSLIVLWIALSKAKRRKILSSESLIPLYSYILKRLKRYKIRKDPSLTDKEFAERQEKDLQEILLPLTELVYDEFYGGRNNIKFDKFNTYYNFEQYLKQKENNLKYYLKKLF